MGIAPLSVLCQGEIGITSFCPTTIVLKILAMHFWVLLCMHQQEVLEIGTFVLIWGKPALHHPLEDAKVEELISLIPMSFQAMSQQPIQDWNRVNL